jgi:hypothetical protein
MSKEAGVNRLDFFGFSFFRVFVMEFAFTYSLFPRQYNIS